jgi:hypothetical protein
MWIGRAVVASVFGGLAVVVAILQVGGLIAARRKGRSYSFVPFVGALLGVAACFIAPWKNTVYAIPAFLVLDPTPVMFAIAALTGRLSR